MNSSAAELASAPEWQAVVSGNAELKLTQAAAGRVPALRLDFDFKQGGGFVVARRPLKRDMPEEYAVSFRLRGSGAVNNLELKLVDATGQNVWRHVQRDLRPPQRWKKIQVRSRDIDFAWGPSSGGRLRELGSMEFAIVAGEGGKGTLWIAGIEIENCGPTEAPELSASSALSEFAPAAALGGTGWKPRPEDPRPWIVVDSKQPRTIGGLIIDWLEQAPSRGFRVRGSARGVRWKTLYDASTAAGRRSYVYLPGVRTRFLRIELAEPSAGAALRLQSFEFSRTIDAFWRSVAGGEARGWHPRWLHNEQTVWTPVGTANGIHCALLNEDGMLEADQGSFSLEPMLRIEDRLFTWADFAARQELLGGWMPVPAVIWEADDWRLRISAEAARGGVPCVHYRFENRGRKRLIAQLFVLVRPFQVTPPWQSFRNLGGVSKVSDLQWRD
ncbi:MAG: discoidin domain-containing protein, partial [Steroidobacteraceae bacterium]